MYPGEEAAEGGWSRNAFKPRRVEIFKNHAVNCGVIQGVSRLEDISAGGDFLGRCDQKSSYKHVSDFGRLRSYDRLKLRREGNNY